MGGVGGGEGGGCFVGLKFMTGSSLGGLGVSVQFLTVLWWLGNGLGFLKGSTGGGGGEGGLRFLTGSTWGSLSWSLISDRKHLMGGLVGLRFLTENSWGTWS